MTPFCQFCQDTLRRASVLAGDESDTFMLFSALYAPLHDFALPCRKQACSGQKVTESGRIHQLLVGKAGKSDVD